MFCNKCGNRNALGSRYCRHCGARLDVPGAATPIAEEEFKVTTQGDAPDESDLKARDLQVQALLNEAFSLNEHGDLNAAVTACTKAVALNPESASAHSLLGLFYERIGEKNRAIEQYEIVLSLNPDSVIERESLRRLQGVPEPEILDTRLSRPPSSPFSLSVYFRTLPIVMAATLGVLLISLAVHNARRPQGLRSPVETVTPFADALRLGQDAFNRGDYAQALQQFQTALSIDPTDSDAQLWVSRTNEMIARLSSPVPQTPPIVSPSPPITSGPTMLSPPLSATNRPPNRRPASKPNLAAEQPFIPPIHLRTGSREGEQPGTPEKSSPSPIRVERSPSPRQPVSNDIRPPTVNPSTTPTIRRVDPSIATPSATSSNNNAEYERKATREYLSGNLEAAAPNYRRALESSDTKSKGQLHQHLGMIYQRKKQYKQAVGEYQQAIDSYQSQAASGVRKREAEIGIRSCQSAMKLCEEQNE